MTAEHTARDRQAIRALAFVTRHVRPAWDEPGVVAAIEGALHLGYPFSQVAGALVDSAASQDAKTPGALRSRLEHGWKSSTDEPPTPIPNRPALCPRCKRRSIGDHVCPDHVGDYQTGAASARAAIRRPPTPAWSPAAAPQPTPAAYDDVPLPDEPPAEEDQ